MIRFLPVGTAVLQVPNDSRLNYIIMSLEQPNKQIPGVKRPSTHSISIGPTSGLTDKRANDNRSVSVLRIYLRATCQPRPV